jgi:hypothetical protein
MRQRPECKQTLGALTRPPSPLLLLVPAFRFHEQICLNEIVDFAFERVLHL